MTHVLSDTASRSRYREARTLVRRLCRLPGEDHAQFKSKIARLREHFERFNVDVSELCQWLMGLRRRYADPDKLGTFGVLGDFLLEPSLDGVAADESERDRWRLVVFDDVARFRPVSVMANQAVPSLLREAMDEVASQPGTPTGQRLFDRMRPLEPAHRLVLLKAAAEWIVARYRRGVQNWERQHAEWEQEREEWERRHPALTEEVRGRFTNVFKSLIWDPDKLRGVRSKRPRICPYERLRQNKDNCIWAGEKGHGPLCWKYDGFVKDRKTKNPGFNGKHFADNAGRFLEFRAHGNSPRTAFDRLHKEQPRCRTWFQVAWQEYVRFMGLNEQTVVAYGRLPHCRKIGETWEKSACEWNPHTELCKQYKRALDPFDDETLKLEPLYRQWRREYLAGPRKPSFRYPSSRELPMPKIFGAGFHEIDFDRSVLRLRLDDMPAGQWIEFAFTPWPRDYRPSKSDVRVTSVHVNFVGTRARVGFRFDVPHKASRFGCTQDELDELRSRRFPCRAQDQQFLDAARECLLESFPGDPQRDLRMLAVDLGKTGAHTAVYQGRTHQQDVPLKIVKIDECYPQLPDILAKDRQRANPPKFDPKADPRGLRPEHVGRHLQRLADGAAKVAEKRQPAVAKTVTAGDHDFRGLKRHVAWMIRDWVRHNASQIVQAAEEHRCDLIVFESLRGFYAPGYDRINPDKKRWLAMFAYGRIRRKVVEKGVERGMRVVTVPYFKSSQVCSACGHEQQNSGLLRKNKAARKFICEGCKAELNSDANAARVLARVFWGEITLPAPES